MKLELEDLDCTGLDIESPGDNGPIRLRFEGISDGRGIINIKKGATQLGAIAIRELILSVLEIPIGSNGTLIAQAPAKLSSATLDGEIAGGLVGQLHFGLIACDSLRLNLGSIHVDAEVHCEELNLWLEHAAGRVQVGNVTLQNVTTSVSGFAISLGTLSFTGLKVAWSQSGFSIEALKAHAQGLAITREGIRIELSGVDLADGFRVAEHTVHIAQLLVGQAQLSFTNLLPKHKKAASDGTHALQVSLPPVVAEHVPAQFDPGILDTVNGQLDVDLTLDVIVPVLGRRRATHHFRVPLAGGILNYRELERDLSDLEDAFIDIKLRGRTLVIERNIPLIPGMGKPIVLWDLSEGDVELAKQHLVRLRTLPNLRFADPGDPAKEQPSDNQKEKTVDKKSKVRIRHLDFDAIAVELSVDDAPVLRGGDGELRTSLQHLTIDGEIYYRPDDEPHATTVAITAKGLSAVATELVVAKRRISGELRLGSVEDSTIEFLGIRPQSLTLRLRNSQLHSCVLELRPAPTNTETET